MEYLMIFEFIYSWEFVNVTVSVENINLEDYFKIVQNEWYNIKGWNQWGKILNTCIKWGWGLLSSCVTWDIA